MADDDTPRYIENDYSHYKPLDKSKKEIRLLHIFPAESPNDELVCGLVRADLDDCPPYTALSYTWGSLDDTVGIKLIFHEIFYIDSSCNVKVGKGPEASVVDNFQITTNLHAGLRSFRVNNETDIFIWADMLCFNQFDLSERSHQVRFMDQVFSRATRVIAWLGGDPESRTYIFSGQVHALTTMCIMSSFDQEFPDSWTPAKEELIAFTKALQNQTAYTQMHAICGLVKSQHQKAANRHPEVNVVDLYLTFVCSRIMSHPAAEVVINGLGSLLDQDTYV
nr:hypothetical protein LTR18_004014 [Exophiala xenobiotica]